jgi:hypothetical protein
MNLGKETGTVRRRRAAPVAAADGPVIALAGVAKTYRAGRMASRVVTVRDGLIVDDVMPVSRARRMP